MTEELKTSIAEIYSTFSVYPLRPNMEGCPCCVSDADKLSLHTKKLKDLEAEDLSPYVFKAMTTWGDTNDFKHYLPRLLELTASPPFSIDIDAVLDKLDYGKWESWPGPEQNAVKQYLPAMWTDLIRNRSFFDQDTFMGIYRMTENMDTLLERWTIGFDDQSFSHFVAFIHDHYNDLMGKRSEFKVLNEADATKLVQWTKSNAGKLEEGFFHFEERDKTFAEKISRAIYIFETNPSTL